MLRKGSTRRPYSLVKATHTGDALVPDWRGAKQLGLAQPLVLVAMYTYLPGWAGGYEHEWKV